MNTSITKDKKRVINKQRTDNKYRTCIYKNGFVIRRPDRKISYLQHQDGSWTLTFIRIRPGKFTLQEQAHYDFTCEKFGSTYSVKEVGISKEEAMELIVFGMTGWFKNIDHKSNIEP